MTESTRSPSQLSRPWVKMAPRKTATMADGTSAEKPNSMTKRRASLPRPSLSLFDWIVRYSRTMMVASTIITTKFSPSSQGVAPAVGLSGSTPEMAMKVANTATRAAMIKRPSKSAQLALVACWLSTFDNDTPLYTWPPRPSCA